MQHAGIELGPHRYDATLQTSTLCYTNSAHTIYAKLHNTRARERSRRGTLSKMIRAETRDFHSRRGMGARTIAWCRCTPLTIVDQFGRGFTLSCEALGRLLKKKKKKKNRMTKIRKSRMSDISCEKTMVCMDS